MKVEIVKVGYLETNCYLLEKNGKVLVIDPGDEFYKIKDAIGEKKVIGVVITHYHDDHIGALKELIDEFDVNTYDVHNLIEGKCVFYLSFSVRMSISPNILIMGSISIYTHLIFYI